MSSKSSKSPPEVIYTRNLNHMRTEELMDDLLPTNYLYSKIAVGEDAARFFTGTRHGADFDLRLRMRFIKGFEALLAASPTDAAAISDAQLECHTVIGIYDMLASQIQEGESSKGQITHSDDMETGE